MLPFPSRQILPCEQIPISSVTVQNPPVLLPPKSACPLFICPGCKCRSQPLPGVSRKQRYNTLDFPRESRVPRKALPSFGNLPPRGTLFTSGLPLLTGVLLAPIGNPEPKGLCPSGHPACPCSGYPSCSRTLDTLLLEQVKQAQRFAQVTGIFLCLFLFSGGWTKHTWKPCRTLGLGWRFSYWSAKTNCPNSLYLV